MAKYFLVLVTLGVSLLIIIYSLHVFLFMTLSTYPFSSLTLLLSVSAPSLFFIPKFSTFPFYPFSFSQAFLGPPYKNIILIIMGWLFMHWSHWHDLLAYFLQVGFHIKNFHNHNVPYSHRDMIFFSSSPISKLFWNLHDWRTNIWIGIFIN